MRRRKPVSACSEQAAAACPGVRAGWRGQSGGGVAVRDSCAPTATLSRKSQKESGSHALGGRGGLQHGRPRGREHISSVPWCCGKGWIPVFGGQGKGAVDTLAPRV